MKIEDLLAPDEVVKLRGPMTFDKKNGFLWVTNRAVYIYHTEEGYSKGWKWEIMHHQDVARIELRRDDNQNMCTINFAVGHAWLPNPLTIPNVTTAETVFCCIKREWSAAKNR